MLVRGGTSLSVEFSDEVPRYSFDLCNGAGFLSDDEGRELEDDNAAVEAAQEEVRALAAGEIAEGRSLLLNSYIAIRRQDVELRKIYFRDVIDVRE